MLFYPLSCRAGIRLCLLNIHYIILSVARSPLVSRILFTMEIFDQFCRNQIPLFFWIFIPMWGHTALIIQLTAPKIIIQHLSIVLIGIVIHKLNEVILWRALSSESTQRIRSMVGTLCSLSHSASLVCFIREIKIFVEPTVLDIWTSLRSCFRFKFLLFFFNSHQTHLETAVLVIEIFGITCSLWLFLTGVSRWRRWIPFIFTRLFTACISFRLDMADKLFNFWDRLLEIVYLFEVWSYLLIFLAPDYSHERT